MEYEYFICYAVTENGMATVANNTITMDRAITSQEIIKSIQNELMAKEGYDSVVLLNFILINARRKKG